MVTVDRRERLMRRDGDQRFPSSPARRRPLRPLSPQALGIDGSKVPLDAAGALYQFARLNAPDFLRGNHTPSLVVALQTHRRDDGHVHPRTASMTDGLGDGLVAHVLVQRGYDAVH